MRYLGGKVRIAKPIANLLNSKLVEHSHYLEPFVGGLNILPHITCVNRYGSDFGPSPLLYQAVLSGQFTPPTSLTQAQYDELKRQEEMTPLKIFAGYGCSFGGKWFGGYARDGSTRSYAANAANSLKKKLAKCAGTTFAQHSYVDLPLPLTPALIYCDPPYEGTTGYGAKFDHEAFWAWCRNISALGHAIFVSEYKAPADFKCVLELHTKTDMHTAHGKEHRIERVFTYGDVK